MLHASLNIYVVSANIDMMVTFLSSFFAFLFSERQAEVLPLLGSVRGWERSQFQWQSKAKDGRPKLLRWQQFINLTHYWAQHIAINSSTPAFWRTTVQATIKEILVYGLELKRTTVLSGDMVHSNLCCLWNSTSSVLNVALLCIGASQNHFAWCCGASTLLCAMMWRLCNAVQCCAMIVLWWLIVPHFHDVVMPHGSWRSCASNFLLQINFGLWWQEASILLFNE